MSARTVIVLTLLAASVFAMTAIARRNAQTQVSINALAVKRQSPSNSVQAGAADQQAADSSVSSASPQSPGAPANIQSSDLPNLEVGLSVEQAYAEIPHRRTIWNESESTVPDQERAYLRTIFQVIDQAIAVRVAGLQNFSNNQFSLDLDGDWDKLITFAQGMAVPDSLRSYHRDILNSFSNQRQFFSDWRSRGAQFEYAHQIPNHSGVRAASASARAAYNELIIKYPNENQNNKDAFYDYHCALDFL